jgi:single-stranded-DNA-specific exonuclease
MLNIIIIIRVDGCVRGGCQLSRWYILVHGDGDGVVTGALAYRALRGEKKVFFTHPAGLHEDLSIAEGNVFIGDIALAVGLWESVVEKLSKLIRSGYKVIYVDHHPFPKGFDPGLLDGNIVHSLDGSASELSYRFFVEKGFIETNMDLERLALFGAISDYLDETKWAREKLLHWDKRMVYFEAGVLSEGLEGSRKMYEFKRDLVKYLSTGRLPSSFSPLVVRALFMASEEEELRRRVEKRSEKLRCIGYIINPEGSVPRAATYVMGYTGKPVGIAVEEKRGVAVMSLRSRSPKINLHDILENLAPKYGGTGGGHSNAAGARIPLDNLKTFLFELDNIVCSITGG